MAAFVASNATWNSTAGNKTVAPTFAVGELIVVISAHSGFSGSIAVSDNQSGTYTLIGTQIANATSADRMAVHVRDTLVSSGVAHTVTTSTGGAGTGGGLVAIRISGMTKVSSAAVKLTASGAQQFAKQENQSAGTPAPAFPATSSAENMCIGAVMTQSNSTTNTVEPSGWAERHDVGYNTPPTGLEVVTRDSGQNTTTVTWGGATPTQFASVIIELDTVGAIPSSLVTAVGTGSAV